MSAKRKARKRRWDARLRAIDPTGPRSDRGSDRRSHPRRDRRRESGCEKFALILNRAMSRESGPPFSLNPGVSFPGSGSRCRGANWLVTNTTGGRTPKLDPLFLLSLRSAPGLDHGHSAVPKLVADTPAVDDEALCPCFAELDAGATHMGVESATRAPASPNLPLQLLLGEDAVGIAGEQRDHFKFMCGKTDLVSMHLNPASGRIDPHRTDRDRPLVGGYGGFEIGAGDVARAADAPVLPMGRPHLNPPVAAIAQAHLQLALADVDRSAAEPAWDEHQHPSSKRLM